MEKTLTNFLRNTTKAGIPFQFDSYGRTFIVKRINLKEWHLRDVALSSRSRFGLLSEIKEDVGSVLETGCLPGGNKGRF